MTQDELFQEDGRVVIKALFGNRIGNHEEMTEEESLWDCRASGLCQTCYENPIVWDRDGETGELLTKVENKEN